MLQFILGFIGVLWGTITDIRTREVPDWLNFSLIAAGIGWAALDAWHFGDILWLLESLVGLGAGFLLGALMYYTGQWGGGDAKLVMGLGALFGIPLTAAMWQRPPFFLLFLLTTIFVGALYGMAWMLVLVIVRRKDVWPVFTKRLRTKKLLRIRLAILGLVGLLILVSLFLPAPLRVLLFVLAAATYLTFYLSILVRCVEQTCFLKEVPVEKLVLGDWLAGEVTHRGKVLVPEKNPGLTQKQLDSLKKHKKTVTVKEGIPFVPSFLVAFVIAYVWYRLGAQFLFWL